MLDVRLICPKCGYEDGEFNQVGKATVLRNVNLELDDDGDPVHTYEGDWSVNEINLEGDLACWHCDWTGPASDLVAEGT